MSTTVYGGWIKNDDIRIKSSSGGVFSAFANEIINRGGTVYGAVMEKLDGRLMVFHDSCKSLDGLCRLRGSKYSDSVLGSTFKKVKKDLDEQKYVLFSGTPCQIGGLYAFLGKEYDRLYTIDFICHGVPSKKLFEEYQKEIEKNNKSYLVDLDFREKSTGWEHYSIKCSYNDGTKKSEIGLDSVFMKLFISDMYIKDSCYNCQYKGTNRKSDITIGDFWGVDRFYKVSQDEMNKGVSVVLCHSEKGSEILDATKDDIYLFNSDISVFDTTNVYFSKNANKPFDRVKYQKMLGKRPLDEILYDLNRYKKVRKLATKVQSKLHLGIKIHRKNTLPDVQLCYSCTSCVNICPKGAISLEKMENGFSYPRVNKNLCVNCGLCVSHCPRNI